MYNVKFRDFGFGQVQTRLYSHLVYTGKKKRPEKREINYIRNPFDGELTPEVNDFDEFDKARERSIQNSLKRAKQKIYDYSRSNLWDWFITLTFNPEKVDRYDYSVVAKKLSK